MHCHSVESPKFRCSGEKTLLTGIHTTLGKGEGWFGMELERRRHAIGDLFLDW